MQESEGNRAEDAKEAEPLHSESRQPDEVCQYLSAIVANSLDAIVVIDDKGVCEYVNDAACQQSGRHREELIGQPFTIVIPPELSEFYAAKWQGVMDGTQGTYEGQILAGNGSRRTVLISSKRITVEGKDKCFSIVRDITELKETQKALQLTNENLDRLVSRKTTELLDTVKARDEMIDALRQSEEKYRQVVENCGLLIITYSCDGHVLYANDRCRQYIGAEPKDIIGRHLSEIMVPDVAQAVMGRIEKMVTKGEVEDAIDCVMTHAGQRWVWGHPNVNRDADGRPTSVTVFLQDITERRLAEIELQKTQEDYRMLVNYAGLIVVRCSLDGVIQFQNDMASQYVRNKGDKAVGRHITEVWGATAGGVFMGGISRALEKGKDIERELRMDTWPNGPRWLWSRYNIMRDAQGTPESVIFFAHDITDQKRAEEAVRDSETNFRTFFESMTDMLIVCSPEGRILFTNPAVGRTLGYGDGELADMRLVDLHPADVRREAEDIFAAMLHGEREECPLPLECKDGGIVPVETRAWLGRWNGNDCVFGVIKNLSTEREAQQRFERLFRNNPALMAVTSVPDERFVDVNSTFMRTLGYSAEEVIGRTADELGLFTRPEQRMAASQRLSAEGRLTEVELQMRCKDGTTRDGLFSGEVIINQGKQYFLTVMVDITEHKLAQQLAIQSDQRYRILLESTPLAVAWFDADSRIVLANNAAAARLKKTPADLIGKRITEVFDMPVAYAMEMRVQKVLAGGPPSEAELESELPIGRRWARTRIDPMRDAVGRIAGAILFVQDITEQKLAQQQVMESEARYQRLIETASVSVTCFDSDLRITLANLISAARFRMKPEEMVGRRMSEILADPWGLDIEGNIRRVLETGRQSEREVEIVFPVGRRWFWSRAIPMSGDDGRPAGVMVFSHDITEQKLVEVALQESEHRRQLLLQTAMEAIFMHEDGVLLEANEQYFEMFGYTPEEIVGKDARSLTLTPESLAAVIENARSGGHAPIQVTCVRKDGTQFPCEVHGHDAVYRGRKVRIAAVQDISERVKAQMELAGMQEKMAVAERLAAVGYIGANMAHEVNTPLSIMRLTAQMIASDLKKPRTSKLANIDRTTTLLREIDRTAEIIRRYREITRPARSLGSTSKELLEIPGRVLEVLRAAAAKVRLSIRIGAEVPGLVVKLGSAEDAEQLFFILIENAIQAADGHKLRHLDISGSEANGKVELRFADDCCGIPPENLGKIFEPFFSTKSRDIGTGLGLCIVRRLLQERGGQIRVESKVGEGSTFTVTYPA
jgi:PAS domain S-box-containing protein